MAYSCHVERKQRCQQNKAKEIVSHSRWRIQTIAKLMQLRRHSESPSPIKVAMMYLKEQYEMRKRLLRIG